MFVRKMLLLVMIAACVALTASSCSRDKKDKGVESQTGLAARVGDIKITDEQVANMYNELPVAQQKEFKGRDGQAKFVDRLIEQHLIYQAALDKNLDKTDEMKDRIRLATMNILVSEYFAKEMLGRINIEPNEIEDYYSSHSAEFVRPPVVRAQYLFTVDSLKAVKWQARLSGGMEFSKLARAESEDKATASLGGDLGFFNPGGYIKSIGTSETFSKAVEQLEVGQLSGIIHLEKGFCIAKVTDKNPVKVQSLDEARKKIVTKLRTQKQEEAYKETMEKLRKKYRTENYAKERLEKTTRTPEEFWEMAQIEPDPLKRIQYYRDLINLYPNHKNAPEALFMIGFTYAEELTDFFQARRTFNELEQKYPGSAIIEYAKWMKENMQKDHPKLESLEGVQKQIKEDKAQKAEGKK
jgi:peptidyl-prolyl cis-trans isomerase C